MMSILYGGHIRAMPAKLLSDNKEHILIRPMAYCQEADIIEYAKEQDFPIIPCNLLAEQNPKVPSNMLHATQSVRASQLLDHNLFNFKDLENEQRALAKESVE